MPFNEMISLRQNQTDEPIQMLDLNPKTLKQFDDASGKLCAVAPLPDDQALMLTCHKVDGKWKKLVAQQISTRGLSKVICSKELILERELSEEHELVFLEKNHGAVVNQACNECSAKDSCECGS